MFLRLGVCTLSEFAGRLLKRGERHAAPFRQKSQVRIAAQRPLMAQLAQEVAHAGMVLQIPQR